MNGTEDVVTIGMRGDGDEAMSDKTDTDLLKSVIDKQRRIIKKKPERILQRHRRYGHYIRKCSTITMPACVLRTM